MIPKIIKITIEEVMFLKTTTPVKYLKNNKKFIVTSKKSLRNIKSGS